ncbi:hypothetical protein, partial [Streptomyces sp. NPDC056697]|uniref:hypothetical protein n=1 Tax=Streptomyces sp. NPDC056697 TaxID=3345915 RepID=UPI0036D28C17
MIAPLSHLIAHRSETFAPFQHLITHKPSRAKQIVFFRFGVQCERALNTNFDDITFGAVSPFAQADLVHSHNECGIFEGM